MVVMMTLIIAYFNPIGFLGLGGAPMCTLWCALIVFATLLNVHQLKTENPAADWTRLAQFILLASGVIIFFDGTNIANRARFARQGKALLQDPALLAMDDALLGWAFPKGQISLWLDTNEYIGVTSTIGMLYTEVLQVMYASYYVWGNGLGAFLAFTYFYRVLYNKAPKVPRRSDRMEWRRIQMFLTAWLGTFLFNFLLNLAVPAVSPRIYLKDDYVNEVKGIYFANLIRKALTSAASNTFSAFPSGHCGLSWLTAYIGYRIGFTRFYHASLTAAVTITLATLVLRYHYFVDMLFATLLLTFGVVMGSFSSTEVYESCVSPSASSTTTASLSPSPSSVSLSSSTVLPRDIESGAVYGTVMGTTSSVDDEQDGWDRAPRGAESSLTSSSSSSSKRSGATPTSNVSATVTVV